MRVMHFVATCLVATVLSQVVNANWQYPQQQPVQQAPPPAPAPAPAPVPGGVPPPVPPPVAPIPPIGPMVPPMVPPIMPPFGFPFPMPFLGPLGFPFLGPLGFPFLGGLGLGLGRLGGLGLGLGLGGGLLGRRFGKRSTEDGTEIIDQTVKCFISSKTKTIDCSDGVGQRVACGIELNFGSSLKLNLTDLAITEKFTPARGEIFNLLSPKSALYQIQHGQGLVGFLTPEMLSSGKFTYIDPITRDPVLLSFYFDVTINEPGFIVKDKVCYDGIVDMILPSIKDVRFDLVVV